MWLFMLIVFAALAYSGYRLWRTATALRRHARVIMHGKQGRAPQTIVDRAQMQEPQKPKARITVWKGDITIYEGGCAFGYIRVSDWVNTGKDRKTVEWMQAYQDEWGALPILSEGIGDVLYDEEGRKLAVFFSPRHRTGAVLAEALKNVEYRD